MKHESFEPSGSFFMLNENVQLGHGDCLELMKSIPDNSIDSIVTDPPAGIGFMNKEWDSNKGGRDSWIQWMQSVMAECIRVLKPGGHALVWAIPRTSHWTATAVENAGFEIRDIVHHVFGSGFPKSHNLKGEWQGFGTALKPAVEHWILVRKPFKGTVAANMSSNNTGAINIDGCKVGNEAHAYTPRLTKNTNLNDDGWSKIGNDIEQVTVSGRWPANLIHDGSDEVLACFPETSSHGNGIARVNKNTGIKSNSMFGKIAGVSGGSDYSDNGNASRFFYCAKASKKDRGENNKHPTVKPHELMKYLCRLITPPNGTILDPFMGSGSTGKAAIAEGFKFIGIEREQEYFDIAKARIGSVCD